MAVQTQIQTRRGTAASWTSTNPTLAAGEIGFETDTGKFKIGNGSTAWASLAYSAGATAVTYLFNATGGQTTFTGADANGLTLAYTVGAEQVYLNGVLQVRGSDYTASNGTSIVLASGALVSDVLNVIAYSAMTITDTYTQAQADAKFVQQTNNFFAGKNKVINGDFGVWQRGTSFSLTSNGGYQPDRFQISSGSGGTCATTQQTFTPGTAPVAGYEGQYFLQVAFSVSGTSTILFEQNIEDVRTLAGQTATFSFWGRVTSGTFAGAAVENVQRFGTGGSGAVVTNWGTANFTTAWQRFTGTVTIPSVSGKTIGAGSSSSIRLNIGTSGTSTFQIWGVQVEAGSIATPFQTATGTLQGELAACQRYYYRFNANGASNFPIFGSGFANTTGNTTITCQFPVTMRTKPNTVDTSSISNFALEFANSNITSLTSITIDNNYTSSDSGEISVVRAGVFTVGQIYRLTVSTSVAAFIGWSAEL